MGMRGRHRHRRALSFIKNPSSPPGCGTVQAGRGTKGRFRVPTILPPALLPQQPPFAPSQAGGTREGRRTAGMEGEGGMEAGGGRAQFLCKAEGPCTPGDPKRRPPPFPPSLPLPGLYLLLLSTLADH